MALVYLDMLKLAVPANIRNCAPQADNQFVVFGSYDLMHYSLPSKESSCALEWLEQQHEKRHDLDWNYERHPVYLYCPSETYESMRGILSGEGYEQRPLVLTMARAVKHSLLQGKRGLDEVIGSLQQFVNEKLSGDADVELAVCWNLGNTDFAFISRPRKLRALEELYLCLATCSFPLTVGKDGPCSKFLSLSSYCALPVDGGRGGHIREDSLRGWLQEDTDVRFVDLVDAVVGARTIDGIPPSRRFLFGDRDYQFLDGVDATGERRVDAVLHIFDQLLNPQSAGAILSSSLIPSLDVGTGESTARQSKDASDGDALVKTYGIEPWESIDAERSSVMDKLDQLIGLVESDSRVFERSRQKCVEQLEHCKNTLDALYKYSVRLYAAAYQDDVLAIVRRIFGTIADILEDNMKSLSKLCNNPESVSELRSGFSNIYVQIMLVVTELQHLFSVLAISPHSYMETYYGSMRSLNASSKLWACYNGVAETICALFPTSNQEENQRCSVLLVPYRDKYSQSRQVLSHYYSQSILVHLQLNYQSMFDTKSTVYAIAHELGHYVFNETRKERSSLMPKAYFADVFTNAFSDILDYPLFFTTHSIDARGREDFADFNQSILVDPTEELKLGFGLNVCSNLGDAERESLYKTLSADLRKRTVAAIQKVVEEFYEQFGPYYLSLAKEDSAFSYYYGHDVCRQMRKFMDVFTSDCARDVYTAIARCNSDFFNALGRYSCSFDRQQVTKLKAYWDYLSYGVKPSDDAFVVPSSWSNEGSEAMLSLFREMHADIFACKVLDFTHDGYLEFAAGFATVSPSPIENEENLRRIMAVSESAFGDDRCQHLLEWLRFDSSCPFDSDVRDEAASKCEILLQRSYHKYLIEYGAAVSKCIDGEIEAIKSDDARKSLLHYIREFSKAKGTAVEGIWRFWLASMR